MQLPLAILAGTAMAAEAAPDPLLVLRPAPGCRVELLQVPREIDPGAECRLEWSFHPGLEPTVEAGCREPSETTSATTGWSWRVAPRSRTDDRCVLDMTLSHDEAEGPRIGVPRRAIVGQQALVPPLHEATPPRPRRQVQPRGVVSLPETLHGEGRCRVDLALDDRGVPVNATVTTCDDESLVERSRQAALDWRFHPATRDDEPVASGFEVRFVYRTPSYQPRHEEDLSDDPD